MLRIYALLLKPAFYNILILSSRVAGVLGTVILHQFGPGLTEHKRNFTPRIELLYYF